MKLIDAETKLILNRTFFIDDYDILQVGPRAVCILGTNLTHLTSYR